MPAAHPAACPPPDASPSLEWRARAWLARIALGDERAMQAFHQGFQDDLLRFLGSRLDDADACREICNAVMLEVWRSAGRFCARSRVTTWLFGIARHRLIDHLRSESRHRHAPLDETLLSPLPGPELLIARQQEIERVQRCLDALASAQRQALWQACIEDLPYARIARLEGCPVGTVKTRVWHAKRRVLQLLAESEAQGSRPASRRRPAASALSAVPAG